MGLTGVMAGGRRRGGGWLSLKVSAILELAHTNNGGLPNKYIPHSLEVALLSSAMIKFHTPATGLPHSSFAVYCECCKKKHQDDSCFTMEDAMTLGGPGEYLRNFQIVPIPILVF